MPLFTGRKLIEKEDGEKIRRWNDGGSAVDPLEQIRKRARAAAEEGMESYKAFWAGISKTDRTSLKVEHEENKKIAERAESEKLQQPLDPTVRDLGAVDRLPDPFDHPSGTQALYKGQRWEVFDSDEGPRWDIELTQNKRG